MACLGVDPLAALLADADWRPRAAAAQAMGVLREPRGIEPVKTLLEDKDEKVRTAAGWALETLSKPKDTKED